MVHFLIWNVWGITGKDTPNRIKALKKSHKIFLLAIFEAKLDEEKIDQYRILLDFEKAVSRGKDTWLYYGSEFSPHIITVSRQCILVEIAHPELNKKSFFPSSTEETPRRSVGIFGSIFYRFWPIPVVPWICEGDFNAIMSTEEKFGGNVPYLGSMINFNQFIFDANLIHAPFSGPSFT